MKALFVALHESEIGTRLPRAYATTCPQRAKADAAFSAHLFVGRQKLAQVECVPGAQAQQARGQ
jgi:hypothetical protein